jgi:glycine hydroxymethyltransferase
LAIERCKKLFGCDHVNIQPLSGSSANAAVYFAVLKPGDKVLGLKLDHGGHLSHGHPVNFSGMLYNFVQYEVDKETGRIDMDKVREIALREKPKMILAGFSAYSRNLDWKRFKEIADEVGALTMADISHVAGLIAGKAIDSPVPYFDIVTTTTHKTLRGPRGGLILAMEETAKKYNFNKAVFPGTQGGPLDHVIAAKAVGFFEASQPSFKDYAAAIVRNAAALAKALAEQGFRLVSGGTDNHLMLVDLLSFDADLSGKKARLVLDREPFLVRADDELSKIRSSGTASAIATRPSSQ